jgi:hypothetical protein
VKKFFRFIHKKPKIYVKRSIHKITKIHAPNHKDPYMKEPTRTDPTDTYTKEKQEQDPVDLVMGITKIPQI